jgi:serine phosphatase RsbU (regulator of sigma subunit)
MMALIEQTQAYLRSIVDTVREPLLVLDENLCVVSAGRSFYRKFQVCPDETEGRHLYELGNGQWDAPALREHLADILPTESELVDFEVTRDFPRIGTRTLVLSARKMFRPGNGSRQILLAMEDVTERRQEEARLRADYERERNIAEALQRPLLMEVPADSFPHLSLATLYEPARRNEADVGGDFFDACPLPRERVALSIGDASGKGLAAAARAMQVKDVLRAFTLEYPHSPAHIVARLNDFVYDSRLDHGGKGEGFVCLALAVLDLNRGEGALVTAGVEPPMILRADGEVETLHLPCLPLGVESQVLYTAQPLRLGRGDTLVMVTDGLTEARSKRDLLGYERIRELVQQHRAAPTLREHAVAVLEHAKEYAGGHLHDDACMLMARRD